MVVTLEILTGSDFFSSCGKNVGWYASNEMVCKGKRGATLMEMGNEKVPWSFAPSLISSLAKREEPTPQGVAI